MKKRLLTILIASALCLSIFLCACNDLGEEKRNYVEKKAVLDDTTISYEEDKEIRELYYKGLKKAYSNWLSEERIDEFVIRIDTYYGCFDGAKVVKMYCPLTMAVIHSCLYGRPEFGNVAFSSFDNNYDLKESQDLFVYKSGELIMLGTAKEKELIDSVSLLKIIEQFDKREPYKFADASGKIEETEPPDFTPLSAQEDAQIREEYRDIQRENGYDLPLSAIKFAYVGSFGGVKVIILDGTLAPSIASYPQYKVAGYDFECVFEICFLSYKDGELCPLGKAFERGWLKVNDIKIINERYAQIIGLY